MSSQARSAFVLGASGMVGGRLVEALSASKHFARVVLINRRILDLPGLPENFEQKTVDFDKLTDYKKEFEGFDVGFCALGTTRAKAGKMEGFYRVDHDYVVDSAKLAKEGGTETFCLVTASGSDENAFLFYSKTKGEVERDVKSIGFQHLIIARPGFLEGPPRPEPRFGESIVKILLQPVKFFSNSLAINSEDVAKALVTRAVEPTSDPVEVLSNAEMIKMGAAYKSEE